MYVRGSVHGLTLTYRRTGVRTDIAVPTPTELELERNVHQTPNRNQI